MDDVDMNDDDYDDDAVDRDDADRQKRQKDQDERDDGGDKDGALESVTASDGTKRAVKYVFTTRGGVRLAIPGGLFFEPRIGGAKIGGSDADVVSGGKREQEEKDGTWIDGAWFPAAPVDEDDAEMEESEHERTGGAASPEIKDYISDAHFDHLVSRVRVAAPSAESVRAAATQRRRRLRARY